MADSAVAITAGSGTNVDTRTEATNGDHRQVIVIGDPSTTAGVAPVDATNGLSVNVSAASGVGSLTEAAPASDTASSGLNGRLQRIAQRITSLIALVPAALGQTTKANSLAVAVASDQSWPTGMACKAFAVAFTTNTRPANVTAYAAGDSISNNATAGSVTALTATVGDTNDDLLTLTHLLLVSTDTGLAGKRVRAYIFNSDPTASSGVGGGDNAAFSNKKAGYVGSMVGVMETGFSDGAVGRLVPAFNDSTASPGQPAAAGGFIICKPSSGGKALWVEYQTLDAFTPSANSTTLIGTICGYQSRAS